MHNVRKFADRLIGLSAVFGSLALLFEVGVILIDVVGRALGKPLYGSQDLTTMAMVILVFGGMAICDRNGGHIAVDLFERKFPPAMNHVIDIIAALLGALIFFSIAYAIYDSSKISMMLKLSTNLLGLQKVWFQWALAGFSILTALGLLLRATEMAFRRHDIRTKAETTL